MVAHAKSALSRGFSLIELMVVVAIVGILASIAAPSFLTLIANQRLKTAASDLVGDLALARGEAVKRSERMRIVRTTALWAGGWQIVDAGNNVILSRPALDPSIHVCTTGTAADNSIDTVNIGPDGTVRTYLAGAMIVGVRAIVISSAPTSPAGLPRMVEFGPTGRATVVVTGVVPCP